MAMQISRVVSPRNSGLGPQYLGLPDSQGNTYEKDTYLVAGGAALPNPIPMFQIQRGKAGSGFSRAKTWKETTLNKAGRLDYPGTVHAVSFDLIPTGESRLDPDVAEFLQCFATHTAVRWLLNGNEVIGERPLCFYHRMGYSGLMPQGGPDPIAVVGGDPSHRIPQLRDPVAIPARTGWTFELLPDESASFMSTVPDGYDFHIVCYWHGRFQRLAQA